MGTFHGELNLRGTTFAAAPNFTGGESEKMEFCTPSTSPYSIRTPCFPWNAGTPFPSRCSSSRDYHRKYTSPTPADHPLLSPP